MQVTRLPGGHILAPFLVEGTQDGQQVTGEGMVELVPGDPEYGEWDEWLTRQEQAAPAAAADGGTSREAAAAALTFAGSDTAAEVYERLHSVWPGGYRQALEKAPGRNTTVPAAGVRSVVRQPYPERVDGYRAQLRNGTDIGPSLAVVHGGHHVLIDGTHRAAARVLEGQEDIPVRVLDLSKGAGG